MTCKLIILRVYYWGTAVSLVIKYETFIFGGPNCIVRIQHEMP